MLRLQLTLASLSGLMAVLFGAFDAHHAPDTQALALAETGSRYQLIHALAVFACFVVFREWGSGAARVAGWLFLGGGLMFAGSLYLLAFTGAWQPGLATPIGGVVLICGWAVLAWATFTGARRAG